MGINAISDGRHLNGQRNLLKCSIFMSGFVALRTRQIDLAFKFNNLFLQVQYQIFEQVKICTQ